MLKLILAFLCLLFILNYAEEKPAAPFAHTFSIVAIDSATGEIGAAVQSNWFSVGSLVIWAEAGVGAVATQSFVNPSFGPRGLNLMKNGKTPAEALKEMIEKDEGRQFRQAALIAKTGQPAAHTGEKCIEAAGHVTGKYFSVQANMMLNATVPGAMAKAFKKTGGSLADRLMAALKAAQAAGGDIRGQQSAAIKVVKGKASGNLWEDVVLDLRVEDHPQAVAEMDRILQVYKAYEHMNAGDLAIEKGDEKLALAEYAAAEKLQPQNLEMKYWHAVSLVNIGKLDEAMPMFAHIFKKDGNWKTLTPRLTKNGLLQVDKEQLDRIMKAG